MAILRGSHARRRSRRGIALLMVLLLLAILGGAVLGGHVVVQQRLRAAHRRNLLYVETTAAESAIRQLLAVDGIDGAGATGTVIRVPLGEERRIAIAWQPAAPPGDGNATNGLLLRATVTDPAGRPTGTEVDYRARRIGDQWLLSRQR